MDGRERQLVHAFVTLADTLVDDYDVVEFAQELVEDCVSLLDVESAGLLLADLRGGLQMLASTSEQTRMLGLLQIQSDAGPCMQAYRTGQQVLIDDLGADTGPWPEFATRAGEDGFGSVIAIPLRLRNERIGALNPFRKAKGRMTDSDLLVAQALADVATIGILHQRVLSRGALVNSQLQTALNSRVLIEQAKGRARRAARSRHGPGVRPAAELGKKQQPPPQRDRAGGHRRPQRRVSSSLGP